MTVASVLQPLIARAIFPDEETAVRELAMEYVLRQVDSLQGTILAFERKNGMTFAQFQQYLHERSRLLDSPDLDEVTRRRLGQSVMSEEDDWLEWKAAMEMLESWLGLKREVAS